MAKPAANKPAADDAAVNAAPETGLTATTAATANEAPPNAAAVAAAKAAREAFMKRVTVKKNVTLPLFKWSAGVSKFLTIMGPVFQGKAIKETGATKNKEPAFLCNVTDLESGELGQIIVATVLKSIFHEEYPEDAYVGKSFEIKQRKIPGKDYNGFDVTEIEIS